ncbi:hypothetical protein Ancab_016526 [Ancistrocladus abbreviatus]
MEVQDDNSGGVVGGDWLDSCGMISGRIEGCGARSALVKVLRDGGISLARAQYGNHKLKDKTRIGKRKKEEIDWEEAMFTLL